MACDFKESNGWKVRGRIYLDQIDLTPFRFEFCATSVRWGGRPDDSQIYLINKSVPFLCSFYANAKRGGECLIKGCVPAEYIKIVK